MAVSLAPISLFSLPAELNWSSGRRCPLTLPLATASASSMLQQAHFSFPSSSFPGVKLWSRGVRIGSFYVGPRRTIMSIPASLVTNVNDSNGSDLPPFEESDNPVSIENLPLESKERMLLEQKLRMKLAKKLRLRRKRLVRKRRMRKKGRWPPSKMKKNKNV